MNKKKTTLFLDIGGVLLTNGWDHHSRKEACEKFGLDYEEMNSRHYMTFGTYEIGKISLDKYLSRAVFYKPRGFSIDDFKKFMFERSKAFPETIEFFKKLKVRHSLKFAMLSNEGSELTELRVRRFKLKELADFFVCSCYVHFRKPDEDIYRLALDIAMIEPQQAIYIDDRAMFAEVAKGMGIDSIHHTGLGATRKQLAEYGLEA